MTPPPPPRSSTQLIDADERILEEIGMTIDPNVPEVIDDEPWPDHGEDDPEELDGDPTPTKENLDNLPDGHPHRYLTHGDPVEPVPEAGTAEVGGFVQKLRDINRPGARARLATGDLSPSELTALVVAGLAITELLGEMPEGSYARRQLERDLGERAESIAEEIGHRGW